MVIALIRGKRLQRIYKTHRPGRNGDKIYNSRNSLEVLAGLTTLKGVESTTVEIL
jgi:hypothetical protein